MDDDEHEASAASNFAMSFRLRGMPRLDKTGSGLEWFTDLLRIWKIWHLDAAFNAVLRNMPNLISPGFVVGLKELITT